jgi:hypothetical protein
MKLFKVWINTDKVGSKCEDIVEIDEETLDELEDDEARLEYIEHECREVAFNMMEWGFEPVGKDW